MTRGLVAGIGTGSVQNVWKVSDCCLLFVICYLLFVICYLCFSIHSTSDATTTSMPPPRRFSLDSPFSLFPPSSKGSLFFVKPKREEKKVARDHIIDASEVSHCEYCPAGYTCDGSATREPCLPGTYKEYEGSDINMNRCFNCLKGHYQDQSAQTTCKTCPAGKEQKPGRLQCQACTGGRYQDQTGYDGPMASCKQCDPGQYQDQSEQTKCKDCEKGHYELSSGKTFCKQCPAGKYQTGEGQRTCTLCPPDEYQNDFGQQGCKWCDDKGFLSDLGGSSIDECTKCPSGFKLTGESRTVEQRCETCAMGLYQDSADHVERSCKECKEGKYNPFVGESDGSCTKCAIGRYSDDLGRTNECDECPFGFVQPELGMRACEECKATEGKWILTKAGLKCKTCATGQYYSQDPAKLAHAMDVKTQEAEMELCPKCPTGYSQEEKGQLQCKKCLPHTYQSTEGNAHCLPCDAAIDPGETTCPGCPKVSLLLDMRIFTLPQFF